MRDVLELVVYVGLALLVPASACRGGTPAAAGGPASGAAPPAACGDQTFPPPGTASGWRHARHELTERAFGPPNHRANDVVVNPGRPQRVVAKFAYGLVDKDLSDEPVDVYVLDGPPCARWRLLGSAVTSDDGDDQPGDWGWVDDGGRVWFELPPESALPLGRHQLRLRVRGDGSTAAVNLWVIAPGTGAVVFDIDGTLTTDDQELVTQVVERLKDRTYVPKPWPAAREVVKAWADRGWLPIYVTGRPDVLHEVTREWLRDQGFPPGPLRLTDALREALPTDGGVGAYKTRVLQGFVADARLDVAACYGNAATDILAYAAAGFPKAATWIIGPHAGQDGTQAVLGGGYGEHRKTLATPPAPRVPAPPVGAW
jgi:hypothetical protein